MSRKRISALNFAAALLAAAHFASPAGAVMNGGVFSVPVLAVLSGGLQSSGGAFTVSGVNMGGPSFSSSNLSGGSFDLATGAAPAIIIIETARANLVSAHCYPVPFKPSAGHTSIIFTALTRLASVRIYTISGELVRSLEKNDLGETLEWDVKNSQGRNVASGVYIFTVKSGSQKASGKLMIIW
ncbi:MAG: hypothetical protein COT18_09085 [Elusimicrobia bacterium CG08_land_8_20_14_0_20_59_10]|nr:MAG: hypothetical protein COT18_09085 [Elusimicrobia bacterium CG08_land_8_20_14_0_20_59_10]